MFAGSYTMSAWIAVFILFILWLIGLFISPITEKMTSGDLSDVTKNPVINLNIKMLIYNISLNLLGIIRALREMHFCFY